jgi:TnpA family transposase
MQRRTGPVTDPNIEALTPGRLSHVDQNYLRAQTHAGANAQLIAAQAKVPLARLWGGGLLASVDGLRFVVPVRTLGAGPSPKYFGYKRGLTWLNAVNDQVSGIGAQIVPGTPRDSLYILDVLLNLDGGPKPDLVATDEASYSDMVFRVFALLGYRFSPRIADIGDTRYWRAGWPGEAQADYGALNAIARNTVNLAKITARVAGHAAGGRVADHPPGPRLRRTADARPGRTPHPVGAGLRRVRADRQDPAPAGHGRPPR